MHLPKWSVSKRSLWRLPTVIVFLFCTIKYTSYLAYGHEIISNEDFWKGFVSSAVIGGVINGIGAVVQGNDFFVGEYPRMSH